MGKKSRYFFPGLIILLVCGVIILGVFSNRVALSQVNNEGHRLGQTPTISVPTMPRQDAFGAIQEIVGILENEPTTDWKQVNLRALREHLIDMNEVTLKAAIEQREVNNGLEMSVTGTDRTKVAIQRLVPAQANELNQLNGWRATADSLPNGVRLTVTSSNPQQADRIRALSFAGLLVSGGHHQRHHLALAEGNDIHQH